MKKNKKWLKESSKTVTPVKHFLSNLSLIVRSDQYGLFKKLMKPNKNSKTLDIGATSDETLKDSNMFEKLYEYSKKLTVATIEDIVKFRKLYPLLKSIKIYPGKKLPFNNKSFDISTSWATVEHVGGYKSQEDFINEMLRIGKKIFLTTPYRGCIYEPHTGLFFLHWLPLRFFRKICKLLNKDFWSVEENLNPLYVSDVAKMKLKKKVKIHIYKTFGLIPTHLVIYSK